jgi:Hemerythrin HHE cation binding domain
MSGTSATALRSGHEKMESSLDRLREIADSLDAATGPEAVTLISEADQIISDRVIAHERDDEREIYPRVAAYLADRHGLGAMSRAHREIIHLARLLRRLAQGLTPQDTDRYLIRDAQRVIESIEALERLHNAQEEDIYEYAIGA